MEFITDREKAKQKVSSKQVVPEQKIVKPTQTKISSTSPTYQPHFVVNPYTPQQYDESSYKESSSLRDLINLGNQKRAEWANRHAQATKNTKILAWGNLFTQLAKIGGLGNAPVTKEENQHLFKAFADVDRMRNGYYATNNAYDNAELNQRSREKSEHKNMFLLNEKARKDIFQKYVDDYNKAEIDKARASKTTIEHTYSDKDAFDRAMREKEFGLKKDNVDSLKQYRSNKHDFGNNKSNNTKDFYVDLDGKRYKVDDSKVTEILNILISDGQAREKYKSKDSKVADAQFERMSNAEKAYYTALDGDLSNIQGVINGITEENNKVRQGKVQRYLSLNPERFRNVLKSLERKETPDYSNSSVNNGEYGFTTDVNIDNLIED